MIENKNHLIRLLSGFKFGSDFKTMRQNILILAVITLIIHANLGLGKPSDDYDYLDIFTTTRKVQSRSDDELEWEEDTEVKLN